MTTNKESLEADIARKAHIHWLSKAKTAVIDGNEMTVLPYGYLETAVKEAIAEERRRIVAELGKVALAPDDRVIVNFSDVLTVINHK